MASGSIESKLIERIDRLRGNEYRWPYINRILEQKIQELERVSA
jgi:hypothetical protein